MHPVSANEFVEDKSQAACCGQPQTKFKNERRIQENELKNINDNKNRLCQFTQKGFGHIVKIKLRCGNQDRRIVKQASNNNTTGLLQRLF